MVWHIFRKDWKLLWQMVRGAAALYVLWLVIEAADITKNHGVAASSLIHISSLASAVLLVVVVVQKDALPGLRQDWLVRPVPRTDLMLGKIAFVVLLIVAPMFVADFCSGLMTGFPAGLALHAAFAQNFRMLVMLFLPMLAFATLTRNLMEAVVAALGAGLAVALFMASISGSGETTNSTIEWIPETIEALSTLTGAALVLGLQYRGRRTMRSRWVCGITIVAALAIEFMPWTPAFAIQERLSRQPDAANAVQIGVEKGRKAAILDKRGLLAHIDLPMNITGVGENETLVDDRTDARIVDKNGSVHPLGRTTFDDGRSSLDYDDRFTAVTIPRETLKSGTASLELDYSLTLLRMTEYQTFSMSSTRLVDGMGVCTTRVEGDNAGAEVSCRLGRSAALTRWKLQGASHYAASTWLEGYSPRLARDPSWHRAMFRLGGPRANWDSRAREEPAADIGNAKIEMRAYEPVAHFTRHVVIPVSEIAP